MGSGRTTQKGWTKIGQNAKLGSGVRLRPTFFDLGQLSPTWANFLRLGPTFSDFGRPPSTSADLLRRGRLVEDDCPHHRTLVTLLGTPQTLLALHGHLSICWEHTSLMPSWHSPWPGTTSAGDNAAHDRRHFCICPPWALLQHWRHAAILADVEFAHKLHLPFRHVRGFKRRFKPNPPLVFKVGGREK